MLEKRQKNTQYYHYSTLNKRPIDTWICVHISSILVYLAFEFVNARFCLIIVIIHPALILPLTNFIYILLAQGFEGKKKMNQVHLIPTHFHLNIRTCLSVWLIGWLCFMIFRVPTEGTFVSFAIWKCIFAICYLTSAFFNTNNSIRFHLALFAVRILPVKLITTSINQQTKLQYSQPFWVEKRDSYRGLHRLQN